MFVLAAVTPALGCRSRPEPAPLVSFDEALRPEMAGKRVALEGRPQLPRVSTMTARGKVYLRLVRDLHEVGVWLPVGTGPNEVEGVRDGYRPDDLTLHTSDGSPVSGKERVRLSGRLKHEKGLETLPDVYELEGPILVERP